MKNFKIFLFNVMLILPLVMFAQQTVKGKVTEAAGGTPLPGVGIIIKGTTIGTASDFDGNYVLENVNPEDVLVFSYVGFNTQSIIVGSKTAINVILTENAESLDEVVVIGYGTARKQDLTGAVNMVNSEDFNDGPVVSAQQLIQGKVAGVQITSDGGAPGEKQSIRIRGTGSLSLTSNPLIVIDGVPMNDGGVGGSRNVLNSINPSDIETMTVLKDASSTAIYGSRAANGVIIITTKKGRAGQDLKVNFNSSMSVSNVNDYVDVLSAKQFTSLINSIGTAGEISRLGSSNTNWQKEIYQVAGSTNSDLSISGSAKNIPFRFSVGYTDTDGVLKSDNFKRTTAKLTLTPSFFDDNLKVELNANGSYIENAFANRDAIGSSAGYDPTQAVYDATSKYGGYSTWINPTTGNKYNLAPTNPLALLDFKDDTSEVRRFIGNAKVDYKLHFFPAVTAVVNVGIDVADSNGRKLIDSRMPASSTDFDGSKDTYSNHAENKLLDFYLNYTKDINEDHNVGFLAGYSYQQFTFNDNSRLNEFFTDPSLNTDKPTVDKSRNVLTSFFGRANYGFKDKYLVTATLRADASSKLNPDDRWGYFPSVAVAWNISNENFLQDSNVINDLKLRLGYGEVGNVNGLKDYQFLTRYTGSVNGGSYQFGDSFYQTYRPEPINENLKWEIGNTINAGIDYSLFTNRVYGSLDVYIKKTKDLIASSTVDPFTNFGNRVDANIGDMENKGLEFALNVVPVKTEDINWTIGYNISYNKNEVTRMPDVQNVGGISGGVNNTIQRHEEGYAPYAFYVYEQVYDANQKPIEGVYVDRNNDNIINDSDRYFYKDPYAEVIMGLNTSFNYKNWDLGITTRASLGNYIYDNIASSLTYENRATENDILSNLSSDYLNSEFKFSTVTNLLSDYYVNNGSFFKVDNITLGYTFPKKDSKNVGIRLFASTQNVLTITDYKGLDPEVQGGIDNNFYPRPQTFLLGTKINF